MGDLLAYIKEEKATKRKGGLYHKTQLVSLFTPNSV